MINTHRSWWRARWRRETPTAILPEDSTADDIAERQAISAVVRQALAKLPRQQRAVLVLRYAADLPEAEIAELLGCSRHGQDPRAPRAERTTRVTGRRLRTSAG
jgi:RNA polymerase sigma factor (sigma-70 family)